MSFTEKIGNQILKLFPMGVFARHVATLMTGTVLAGAIGIIVMPVLTRLYRPEHFGVFAIYTSLLGVLSVVACWRYELAIVLPEKDEDAANLLLLCTVICFFMGLSTLILVAIFRTSLASLLRSPVLGSWLWFLPLSLIAAGLFHLLNYWSTRRKHFKRLAMRRITQSGITTVTQIGAGVLCNSVNVGGLIGGSIIGQLAAAGRLAWQVEIDEGKFIKQSLSRSGFIQVAKRYKKFPLFDVWSGLLNTGSTMLPTLLLGYFFTPVIVGLYALGYQVLAVPMSLVGTSIAQVFFPQANQAKRVGDLDRLTLKVFERLLSTGLVPIILLTIIAPDLFAVLFGTDWFTAGEYLRWMSLWLLFVFVSSPLSHIYSILEKQKEGLIVNSVMFFSRLIVLIIGGIRGDAIFTIALFGITGTILWIFNCMYIQHLAGVSPASILRIMVKQCVYGTPYIFFPLLIYFVTPNPLALISAGIGAGTIFFIVQAFRMRTTGEVANSH